MCHLPYDEFTLQGGGGNLRLDPSVMLNVGTNFKFGMRFTLNAKRHVY
jgi:hypothetical protein